MCGHLKFLPHTHLIQIQKISSTSWRFSLGGLLRRWFFISFILWPNRLSFLICMLFLDVFQHPIGDKLGAKVLIVSRGIDLSFVQTCESLTEFRARMTLIFHQSFGIRVSNGHINLKVALFWKLNTFPDNSPFSFVQGVLLFSLFLFLTFWGHLQIQND